MSKNMKKISEKFNKLVDNFLTDLQSILPDETEVTVLKSQIAVATMWSENKILKSFVDYVYPYKEHIMEKNEEFFLGDDISEKKDYLSEALHMADLWQNKLSDDNKDVVWKYFQVMVVLAEKVV